MKKLCIVTLYGNYNLGNRLQNFAVQKKCEELGFLVDTLKVYNAKQSSSKIKDKVINELKRLKHSVLKNKSYINIKFEDFENKYIKLAKREIFSNEKNNKLNKKYDFFMVGSDQVWNPDFGLEGDLTFLEFVKDKPSIAISASIGVNTIPDNLREKYRNGLNHLNYISVREQKAKDIVEDLTGRTDVQELVDPTMLLSHNEWEQVSRKPNTIEDSKYILTYFLGNMSEEAKKQIDKLAKKQNLKIIDVIKDGSPQEWIGPSEFIYLEQHAELICTDSFHSCVFGILMQTPFIVFDRKDDNKPMNSRIETLLSKFDLKDRKYNGHVDEKLLQCDYSHCESILIEERKKTEKFLRKALEIER